MFLPRIPTGFKSSSPALPRRGYAGSTARFVSTLKGLKRFTRFDATLSGFFDYSLQSQVSACVATLGWRTKSLGISGHSFTSSLWLSSDLTPIGLAHIFINFNGRAATIQRITAPALGTGNPVILTRLNTKIIGLASFALETLECLTIVVKGTPGFGKGDATYTRRPRQHSRFALNVHYPPGLRSGLARG